MIAPPQDQVRLLQPRGTSYYLSPPQIFRPSYSPKVRYVGEIGMGKPLFSLDLSECPAMNATAATTNARLGRARQAGNSGL